MLTRRVFGACALCAPIGLAASGAGAQVQPQTAGGVTRAILRTTPVNDTHDAVLVLASIEAGTTVARHTHPGVESAYVLEGGFDQFSVEGQHMATLPKAGESFQIAAGVPHGSRTGPQPTKLVITYVVERGKPLASPA
jgi:quercetin dioxygenase-like cupin family protein